MSIEEMNEKAEPVGYRIKRYVPFPLKPDELKHSSPIFQAIIDDNLGKVQQYARDSGDMFVVSAIHQWSLLDVAAMYSKGSIVDFLLTQYSTTPHIAIFRSVFKGDLKEVQEYVANGGDLTVTLPNGRKLLDAAILAADEEAVLNCLLSVEATWSWAEDPQSLFYQLYKNEHNQVYTEDRHTLNLALAHGVRSPHLIQNVETLRFNHVFSNLLFLNKRLILELETDKGLTPLLVAAEISLAMVKLLVRHGANLRHRCKQKFSVVERALFGNQPEVVRYLATTCGRPLDVPHPTTGDSLFSTIIKVEVSGRPLTSENKLNLFNLLIELGADVNAKNKDYQNAFCHACNNNETNLALRLIEASADVDQFYAKPGAPKSCLSMACSFGGLALVQSILRVQKRKVSQNPQYAKITLKDRFEAYKIALLFAVKAKPFQPAMVDLLFNPEISPLPQEEIRYAALAIFHHCTSDVTKDKPPQQNTQYLLYKYLQLGFTFSDKDSKKEIAFLKKIAEYFTMLDLCCIVEADDEGNQYISFRFPNLFKFNKTKGGFEGRFTPTSLSECLPKLFSRLSEHPEEDFTPETFAQFVLEIYPEIKDALRAEIEKSIESLTLSFDDPKYDLDFENALKKVETKHRELTDKIALLQISLDAEKDRVQQLKQNIPSQKPQKKPLDERQLAAHQATLESKKAELDMLLKMAKDFKIQAEQLKESYVQNCDLRIAEILRLLLQSESVKAHNILSTMQEELGKYEKFYKYIDGRQNVLKGIETKLNELADELSLKPYSRALEQEDKKNRELQAQTQGEQEKLKAITLQQKEAAQLEAKRKAEAKKARKQAFKLKQKAYEAQKALNLAHEQKLKADAIATQASSEKPSFPDPLLYQAPAPGQLGKITQLQENMDVLHEISLLENILKKPKNVKLKDKPAYYHTERRAILGLFARIMEFIKDLKGPKEPVPADLASKLRVYLFKGKQIRPADENDIKECAELNAHIKDMVQKLIGYYRKEKEKPSRANITVVELKQKVGSDLFSKIIDESESMSPKEKCVPMSYEDYRLEIVRTEKELEEEDQLLRGVLDEQVLGWATGFSLARLGSMAAGLRDNHHAQYRKDKNRAKYDYYIQFGNQFRHEARLPNEVIYQVPKSGFNPLTTKN